MTAELCERGDVGRQGGRGGAGSHRTVPAQERSGTGNQVPLLQKHQSVQTGLPFWCFKPLSTSDRVHWEGDSEQGTGRTGSQSSDEYG